jgi:hypothetical protein
MKKIFFVLFLAVLSFFTYRLHQEPSLNWDVLPYMALELKMDGHDTKEQHQLAYEALKRTSPETFKQCTYPGGEYEEFRAHMYTHPDAFQELLSMYDIKPAYVAACYVAWQYFGYDLAYSTYVPNILAFFCIGLIFFMWASRYLSGALTFLLGCMIMASDSLHHAARMSNPDLFGAALLLFGLYILFEFKKTLLAAIFVGLSILARPDGIILAGMCYGFIFLLQRKAFNFKWAYVFLSFGLIIGAYLLPKTWTQNPGYGVLFYHTFYKYFLYPVSQNHGITFAEYFFVLQRNAFHFFKEPLVLYLFFTNLVFFYTRRGFNPLSLKIEEVMFFAITAAYIIRFIVYPFMWPGYWLTYYFLLAIIAIKSLVSYRQTDED